MGSIAWTDSEGAAVLSNDVPSVGGRFKAWTSRRRPVGPRETALGTGRLFRFAFRYERIASFTLDEIPTASQALMDRLIEWLEDGGTVQINTGDNASRVYTAVGLAEGTDIDKQQQSGADLTYRLSLTVVNLANDDDLICDYTDQ